MDKSYEINVNSGNVKISEEVIATISQIAVSEVEGIIGTGSSLAGEIKQILSKKTMTGKGVKVEISESDVTIDINVIVKYGTKIPEAAWEIQENVKKNVESMTGLSVCKVNVHVTGIEAVEEVKEIKEDNEEKKEDNE